MKLTLQDEHVNFVYNDFIIKLGNHEFCERLTIIIKALKWRRKLWFNGEFVKKLISFHVIFKVKLTKCHLLQSTLYW